MTLWRMTATDKLIAGWGSMFKPAMIALCVIASVPAISAAQAVRLVTEIGQEDGPLELTFGSIVSAAFGPRNEIYVLDDLSNNVRVFSLDGKLLSSFGRPGQGPGEFSGPSSLTVTPSEVRVMDRRLSRIVTFASDGRHQRTYEVPAAKFGLQDVRAMRFNTWIGSRITAADSRVLGPLVNASRSEIARQVPHIRRASQYVVVSFRTDAAKTDTLLSYDHGFVQYITPGSGFSAFRGWANSGSWAVSGDSLVALLNTASGELRVLEVSPSGLKLRSSLRIPVAAKTLSETDWRRAESEAREDYRIPQGVHLIGPRVAPQLGSMVIDDRGTVWIERIRPSGSARATAYMRVPLNGPRSEIEIPGNFKLLDVREPYLLGTRTTSMDVELIQVWRVGEGRR